MKYLATVGLFVLSLMMCHASGQNAPAESEQINVLSCGAKGDGKTDDTAAFLESVKLAEKAGVSVFTPKGVYKISKPITLKNIAMVGPEGGAWNADTDALPVLIPSHRDGPCVILDAGGGLKGICIRYEWKKEPDSGPPAVLVQGIGAFISCVKIMYPWDGIMTDGSSNVGRLNIENVFMVSPRNIGVRVTGTWDVPTLRNVEVWNAGPVARPLSKGIGFDLGKNDLIRLSNCFAFAMDTGFMLRDEIPGCKIKGGTWGVMSNCATDYCVTGIEVHGENTLSVSGGSFWEHQVSLLVDGPKARVRISGSELKSNAAPAVRVLSADQVVINGCSLLCPMLDYKPIVAQLEGGRIALTGCAVQSMSDGIEIGPKVIDFASSGNVYDTPNGKSIVDHRQKPADK
jgi:hypothetical protein